MYVCVRAHVRVCVSLGCRTAPTGSSAFCVINEESSAVG